jgi:hypothetical protein
MIYRQSGRKRPPTWVSSNAVVPSTLEGITSFLDRLSRMLSRNGFRADESREILAAIEQILLLTVNSCVPSDVRRESRAFFTLGPSEISICIENQGPQFSSAISLLSGVSPTETGSNSVEAVTSFMEEIRCNAKCNTITLVRRRNVNHKDAGKRQPTVCHPQSR